MIMRFIRVQFCEVRLYHVDMHCVAGVWATFECMSRQWVWAVAHVSSAPHALSLYLLPCYWGSGCTGKSNNDGNINDDNNTVLQHGWVYTRLDEAPMYWLAHGIHCLHSRRFGDVWTWFTAAGVGGVSHVPGSLSHFHLQVGSCCVG